MKKEVKKTSRIFSHCPLPTAHCPLPTAHCPLLMRWLPFLILAYLTVGLQVGLGGWLSVGGARPDFVLLAAAFVCLSGPAEGALLGCLALGVMQDFVAREPFGTYALAYGLAGLIVVGAGREVGRDHPITHAVLTLLAGITLAVAVALINRARGMPGAGFGAATLTIFYTALLAPIVLWALRRMKGLFVRRLYQQ